MKLEVEKNQNTLIISNAEPGELRDVEDEIYDFLDNFTTFQSNYKELTP